MHVVGGVPPFSTRECIALGVPQIWQPENIPRRLDGFDYRLETNIRVVICSLAVYPGRQSYFQSWILGNQTAIPLILLVILQLLFLLYYHCTVSMFKDHFKNL